MPGTFSTFTIEALVEVISGGPGLGNQDPPISLYRSGPEIEGFLMGCGIDPAHGSGSRLPTLRGCLKWSAAQPNGGDLIQKAIEQVADPRQYRREPEKTNAVMAHLNGVLAADGFEIVEMGGKARLKPLGSASAAVAAIAIKSAAINFDTVNHEIKRALEASEADPEDAITAACSMLEAVCRSILIELGQELPSRKDVQSLVKAVQEPLGLSPARPDLPSEVAGDVRQVLQGLATAAAGIGALRTHAGDAHGRERRRTRVDARIARLAIHAASTLALFLVETWERTQKRALLNRNEGT